MGFQKWEDVPGFAGRYKVSNLGQVYSVPRTVYFRNWWGADSRFIAGKFLNPKEKPNGYLSIALSAGGDGGWYYLHRVVAKAFFGPPPTKNHEVNHINGCRNDNRACNLEWVTRTENHRHARDELGNVGENKTNALSKSDVLHIRARRMLGESTTSIAEDFDCGQNNIGVICRGETWKHLPNSITDNSRNYERHPPTQ